MKYKFNVNPEDCRYIINIDKRKIICLIENTERMFITFAANNFDIPYDCMDSIWSSATPKHLHEKLRMPNRFWGIATCSEEDEWDEEKGKLLAFAKAKNKLNKSFFKRANLYIHTFDKSINDAVEILNTLGDKLTANTARRYAKLNKLLGDTENGVSEN